MEPSGYFWLHALYPYGSTIKRIEYLWSHRAMFGSIHCSRPIALAIRVLVDLKRTELLGIFICRVCRQPCDARFLPHVTRNTNILDFKVSNSSTYQRKINTFALSAGYSTQESSLESYLIHQ